ncbi:MAG: hypothetical protein Q7K38_00305 [Candidatus Wildermuthbacteria bacterium]|nr:hypothetical protein [Candidatus Wildermuthbacteria bacterium]
MKMKLEDKLKSKQYQEAQLEVFILSATELLIKIRDAFFKLNDPDFRLRLYADYVDWDIRVQNLFPNIKNLEFLTKWLSVKSFQPVKYPRFNVPGTQNDAEIREKIVNDLNDLKAIVAEKLKILNEFKDVINKPNGTQEKRQLDYKAGILYFADEKIDFSKKPNQKRLLQTLFVDPMKEWFYDEVQEEWDPDWDGVKKGNPNSEKYWQKFYSAGDDINTAIAKKTKTDDFILKNTGTKGWIKINPNYL